jgi:purine-nucleoside phosphorylase
MAGQSPLRGPNEEVLGVRFLDMLHAYDASLRAKCIEIARQNGFADKVREGVYAMVGGPAFETMAEIRFLQKGGADAVGMSTIPEVIVARHEGMRVLGISAITDMAVGTDAVGEISHTEVLAAAEEIKPRLTTLVRGVVEALAD